VLFDKPFLQKVHKSFQKMCYILILVKAKIRIIVYSEMFKSRSFLLDE
jgi:hypothetical protein